MPLSELNNFLRDESQVAHVAKSDPLGLLHFVISLLTFVDLLRDPPGLENVNGQYSVVSTVHMTVEYLLNNIVNHIVKEVVPRKPEKEALQHDQSQLFPFNRRSTSAGIHTKIVGTTLCSTNMILR